MSLITSNIAQLKTLIYADRDKNLGVWVSMVVMIVCSLMLQIVVGGMLFYIVSQTSYGLTATLEK